MENLDFHVRRNIYDVVMRSGRAPLSAEVAKALDVPAADVAASFRRLAEGRVLVLERERGEEILMAPPFSAVPTCFSVETASGFQSYGNCIWDALGVAAMMGEDARIDSSCGDCGAALPVEVRNGAVHGDGIIHFALPAREWWHDVVFT